MKNINYKAGLAITLVVVMVITMVLPTKVVNLSVINKQMNASGATYEVTYLATTANDLKETKDNTAIYFLEKIPQNNVTCTATIQGWIVGEDVGKVVVVLNGTEYTCTRSKRADVGKSYPQYDVSNAGFQLEINATQLENGANALEIREYKASSTKTYNVLYTGTVNAIKMDNTYFDWSWYYFYYHSSDSDVKQIGKDPESLKEHYYKKGIDKGYSPCIAFDPKWYKDKNTDGQGNYGSIYAHFIKECLEANVKANTSQFLDLSYFQKTKSTLSGKTAKEIFLYFLTTSSRMGEIEKGNDTDAAKALAKMYVAKEYASLNEDIKQQCGDGTTVDSAEKLWSNWLVYSLADNVASVSSEQFDMAFYMENYEVETAEEAFWRYINSGYSKGEITLKVVTTAPATTVPTSTTPASTAPASTTPTSTTLASETPTSTTLASTTPASTTPVSTTLASTAPVGTVPVSTTPVSTTPASETPASTTPASTTPVSTALASITPVSIAPTSTILASTTPASTASASTKPATSTTEPSQNEETAMPVPTLAVTPVSTPTTEPSLEVTPSAGITRKTQKITAKSITKTYGSKPFFLNAKTSGDGMLIYESSSKKVATVSLKGKVTIKGYGKTTVTISASSTNLYKAATKKITITVVPKTISIKKLTSPAARKITCSWKKNSTVDGYHIHISLRKKFDRETYDRFYEKKRVSTTLPGVTSGKRYYFRIRGYKKVGKKTYYGAWSKVMSVKVK